MCDAHVSALSLLPVAQSLKHPNSSCPVSRRGWLPAVLLWWQLPNISATMARCIRTAPQTFSTTCRSLTRNSTSSQMRLLLYIQARLRRVSHPIIQSFRAFRRAESFNLRAFVCRLHCNSGGNRNATLHSALLGGRAPVLLEFSHLCCVCIPDAAEKQSQAIVLCI